MAYIDGFMMPVPKQNRALYKALCQKADGKFKAMGALSYVECWEDDVPEGKVNSFHSAVLRKPDEAVVLAWVIWPSKEIRNKAWEVLMDDPEMREMPFDGARMIYGGFDVLFAAGAPVAG